MRLLCQAVVSLALVSVPGWSDVLYSTGAIDGGITSYSPAFFSLNVSSATLGGSCSVNNTTGNAECGVFDTFTPTFDGTVTGVSNIGLWVPHEDTPDTPTTLSWYICESICVEADNTPSGVLASGTSVSLSTSLVASDVEVDSTFYDVYSVGFSVGDLFLTAADGPYTLELYDGVDTDNDNSVGWDVNGPSSTSTAYQSIYGSPETNANSFEIDGTTGVVAPEPGTFPALVTGLLAISLLSRRRTGKRSAGQ
jgi:hypothetical protein